MAFYRKPGVYLEEGTLTGPGEIGLAQAYGLFVGAAPQGPTTDATLITSWNEYEAVYGGWRPTPGTSVSYLPYAVWSFYQNGGRNAWVQRAAAALDTGDIASVDVMDAATTAAKCFTVNARSAGEWGTEISLGIHLNQTGEAPVYSIHVFKESSPGFSVEVERFQNISPAGTTPGTKRVDNAINDEVYGSRYIRVADLDQTKVPKESLDTPLALAGTSLDAAVPASSDLISGARSALGFVEGPVVLNIAGFRDASTDAFVSSVFDPTELERGDVFVINDNCDRRDPGQASNAYGQSILDTTTTGTLGGNTGNSYVASYTPWITVADPAVNGGTLVIPPGGAVCGMMARNDVASGVFQAPAGVQFGGLNNALSVDAKYTDAMLGSLNSANINVIRPIMGAGIVVMGGRTRKNYAVDKYINARRTLIYLKETLKRSCEFAVFRNNDQALWNALQATAELILRPVWLSGGLKGSNADQAYKVVCDATINTPAVVASGEVRMEISVALQTPAEFVVIRVSQMSGGGTSVTEI
jgi:Bacteriophage tail sheath protein